MCPSDQTNVGPNKDSLRSKINAGQSVAELKVQEPISFQGQTAILCEVTEDWVRVDKPFRLKATDDWTLRQSLKTAVRSQMHTEAAKAWNHFWQRDKNMGPRDCKIVRSLSLHPLIVPPWNFGSLRWKNGWTPLDASLIAQLGVPVVSQN